MKTVPIIGARFISAFTTNRQKMTSTKVVVNFMENIFCLKHFFIKCAVFELFLAKIPQNYGYFDFFFGRRLLQR